MGKTIFIGARKGGVGKTMTTASLGVSLAREGKKILLIDADSQFSLTVSFGVSEPEKLQTTLATVLNNVISEREFDPLNGIIHTKEGVDLLAANSSLTGIELTLAQLIGRETILRQYIEKVKNVYDFILIDTSPTLDLLTVNALAASDSVIIPISPKFLDAKGLELLLKSVAQIKRQINPKLEIEGILLTMVDNRAKHTQNVIKLIQDAYGGNIRIFTEHIPRSIRASEATAQGISIFSYDPKGKVAAGYSSLAKEVNSDAT